MNETELFNKMRLESWEKKLNSDGARVLLIIGIQKSGTASFIADPEIPLEKIAERMQGLLNVINFHLNNKKSN